MRFREEKRLRRKDALKAGVAAAVALALLAGGAAALHFWENDRYATGSDEVGSAVIAAPEEQKEITYDGSTYRQRSGLETYLIMGIDVKGKAVAVDSYEGGGQADDTAAGKVGARQDDAARNAERERKGRSGQRDDVRDGADLQEVMVDDGGVDDEDRHQDVQRIVQNAVRPEAALVAPVQLAVVRSRIANFCHRICHDRGPPLNVFCCQPHDLFLAGRFGIHFTGKAAA